ncbi:hypothetical protein HSB1_43570 [Halogranum salarium B-1]|uniref:Small CPxCG-related zinc finger protein n=1 Tax=Halogranum salarium B-1 TaxID=1210908 RepID=J3JDD5_9EURY|nr:hypothetical protein HSB1_43570 [Halogranum salarium B-1]
MGWLFARLFTADETVVHECRQCGATLDNADESCSACESTDVSTYRF